MAPNPFGLWLLISLTLWEIDEKIQFHFFFMLMVRFIYLWSWNLELGVTLNLSWPRSSYKEPILLPLLLALSATSQKQHTMW